MTHDLGKPPLPRTYPERKDRLKLKKLSKLGSMCWSRKAMP